MQINLRVGIINSLMPSQCGIKRIANVCYITNRKSSKIRWPITP